MNFTKHPKKLSVVFFTNSVKSFVENILLTIPFENDSSGNFLNVVIGVI